MTRRLVQCKGSLARAALPFASISSGGGIGSSGRWSGAFSLDDLFDRAHLVRGESAVDRSSWACTSAKWWRWIPRRLPAGERRRARRCWARVLAPGRAGGAGQHRGGPPGSCGSLGCGRLGPAGPLWGQLRRGDRGVRGPAQRGPPALGSMRGLRPRSSLPPPRRDALTGRLRINWSAA